MARRAAGQAFIERARQLARTARSAEELRVAQAVLLPLEHGMSLEQVAAIVGRSRSWVARQRTVFIKAEGSTKARAAWGGRRNALLSEEQEREIVKAGVMLGRFAGPPWSGKSQREFIRERLEQKLRRPVSDSTLDGIIRRVAKQFVPEGSAFDLSLLSGNLTEVWLRERVQLARETGKKLSV